MASSDAAELANRMSELRIEDLKQQLCGVDAQIEQASSFPYEVAIQLYQPLQYAAELLHKDIEIEELNVKLRVVQHNYAIMGMTNQELARQLGMRETNVERAQHMCLELMLENENLKGQLERVESHQTLDHKWACRSATDLGSILQHVYDITRGLTEVRNCIHGANSDNLQYSSWLIFNNHGHLVNRNAPAALQNMMQLTESIDRKIAVLDTSIKNVNVRIGPEEFVDFSNPAWKNDLRITAHIAERVAHSHSVNELHRKMNMLDFTDLAWRFDHRIMTHVAVEIAKSKSENGNGQALKTDGEVVPVLSKRAQTRQNRIAKQASQNMPDSSKQDRENADVDIRNVKSIPTLPDGRVGKDITANAVDFSLAWKNDQRVVNYVAQQVVMGTQQSSQILKPLWHIGFAVRKMYLECLARKGNARKQIVNEGLKAFRCGSALTDAILCMENSTWLGHESTALYHEVYGISPMKVYELRHCTDLIRMLSQYVSIKGWRGRGFGNTEFSKSWPAAIPSKYKDATPEAVAQDFTGGRKIQLIAKLDQLYREEEEEAFYRFERGKKKHFEISRSQW